MIILLFHLSILHINMRFWLSWQGQCIIYAMSDTTKKKRDFGGILSWLFCYLNYTIKLPSKKKLYN